MGSRIGIVVDGLGINQWVDANVLAGEWYAQAHGIELDIAAPKRIDPEEQMTVIREVADRNPDAIVVMPIRGEAVEPALSYTRQKGIAVITEDMLVRTQSPLVDVRFDGFQAGAESAMRMFDLLDDLHGTKEEEGIIVVVVSHRNPHQMERSNGFFSKLKSSASITAVECDITPCAEMTENTRQSIAGILNDSSKENSKRVIGCFGYGNLVTIGIAQAVVQEGFLHPRTEREHIVVSGIDACPQTIDLMKNGQIDVLVDQPCSFYIPIALHYVERYLKDGEGGLPEVGRRVGEDELVIEGADPYGIKPWKVQAWSPAEVESSYGHRWFKTNSITVTPENCDAGWLWGNFIREVG